MSLGLVLMALAILASMKKFAEPGQEVHSLVLTATGTARVTSLTYTLDGRVIRTGPASLPWGETVSVPADGRKRTWALDAEFGAGEVTLAATVNGQPVTQSSGGGEGPDGNVSIDGDLTAGR